MLSAAGLSMLIVGTIVSTAAPRPISQEVNINTVLKSSRIKVFNKVLVFPILPTYRF